MTSFKPVRTLEDGCLYIVLALVVKQGLVVDFEVDTIPIGDACDDSTQVLM